MTFFFFFFNDTATTEIYTLSLHDALPISDERGSWRVEMSDLHRRWRTGGHDARALVGPIGNTRESARETLRFLSRFPRRHHPSLHLGDPGRARHARRIPEAAASRGPPAEGTNRRHHAHARRLHPPSGPLQVPGVHAAVGLSQLSGGESKSLPRVSAGDGIRSDRPHVRRRARQRRAGPDAGRAR